MLHGGWTTFDRRLFAALVGLELADVCLRFNLSGLLLSRVRTTGCNRSFITRLSRRHNLNAFYAVDSSYLLSPFTILMADVLNFGTRLLVHASLVVEIADYFDALPWRSMNRERLFTLVPVGLMNFSFSRALLLSVHLNQIDYYSYESTYTILSPLVTSSSRSSTSNPMDWAQTHHCMYLADSQGLSLGL